MGTTTYHCVFCGRELEETEYNDCVDCADSGADFEDDDFFYGRFEMETDEEYDVRMEGN